jgi:hypothetical protein
MTLIPRCCSISCSFVDMTMRLPANQLLDMRSHWGKLLYLDLSDSACCYPACMSSAQNMDRVGSWQSEAFPCAVSPRSPIRVRRGDALLYDAWNAKRCMSRPSAGRPMYLHYAKIGRYTAIPSAEVSSLIVGLPKCASADE